jgi:DHA2 family multidrug resistance protein
VSDGGTEHDNWRPSGNPWLIAVVVTMAAFMELLDTTIVNVSLPHIAGNLSASYDEATWTLTSYLVANSIVLPISAFFGRLIGRKRYFVICIAAFTVCSASWWCFGCCRDSSAAGCSRISSRSFSTRFRPRSADGHSA